MLVKRHEYFKAFHIMNFPSRNFVLSDFIPISNMQACLFPENSTIMKLRLCLL